MYIKVRTDLPVVDIKENPHWRTPLTVIDVSAGVGAFTSDHVIWNPNVTKAPAACLGFHTALVKVQKVPLEQTMLAPFQTLEKIKNYENKNKIWRILLIYEQIQALYIEKFVHNYTDVRLLPLKYVKKHQNLTIKSTWHLSNSVVNEHSF